MNIKIIKSIKMMNITIKIIKIIAIIYNNSIIVTSQKAHRKLSFHYKIQPNFKILHNKINIMIIVFRISNKTNKLT